MARKAQSRQERIYQSLLDDILKCDHQPGDYLPTVRELATRFGTSITPVYLAINRLEEEGYISKAHGSGIQLLTRDPAEATVKRKPSIDFLGSAPNFTPERSPSASHFILAASDWLLWGLTHSKQVRVSASHFPYRDDKAFREILEECRYSDSNVIAFADPENLSRDSQRLLNSLRKAGKHIVHLGNREDLPQFDRVRSDFRAGSHALTRYLLEQGHTCLLRLNTSFDNWYEQRKQEGYLAAIDEWNQERGANVIGLTRTLESVMGAPGGEGESEVDLHLLRDVLEFHPVTAILAPTDASVLYLRHAAHLMDRTDLEIAGYDASWPELWTTHPHDAFVERHAAEVRRQDPPPTVELDVPALGSELAKLAVDRALGRLPGEPQTVMCPQKLKVAKTK